MGTGRVQLLCRVRCLEKHVAFVFPTGRFFWKNMVAEWIVGEIIADQDGHVSMHRVFGLIGLALALQSQLGHQSAFSPRLARLIST